VKAVIYLRISQDRSGEELGVDRQREDCLKLAERRGWDVIAVFIDNDISATSGKARPQWEQMMRMVEAGEVAVVIGWTVDRVLRSGRDRLRMLDAGRAKGITISLVRGSDMDLSTPSGRLVADVLAASAQAEVEFKSDRQKRMHRQAASQGRRVGGRRPFGYEDDGMELRKSEADAVRDAYTDYLAGTPLTQIARRWNVAGLLSGHVREDGTASEWTHSAVRSVLQNPRYMGMRRHQPLDGDEAIYPAAWPAIVPETTWRATIALLGSVAAEFKPRAGRRLLTGIATCGGGTLEDPEECGLGVHVGGNKKGTPPVYRCPTGKHVTRRAEPIEEFISHAVVLRCSRPDALREVAAFLDDGRTAELTEEAERIRLEMDTIARERMQRVITPRQFSLMNADLVAQLETVERRMSVSSTNVGLREFVMRGPTLESWNELGVDRQRVLVSAMMTVQLYSGGRGVRKPPPETIAFKWRDLDEAV